MRSSMAGEGPGPATDDVCVFRAKKERKKRKHERENEPAVLVGDESYFASRKAVREESEGSPTLKLPACDRIILNDTFEARCTGSTLSRTLDVPQISK